MKFAKISTHHPMVVKCKLLLLFRVGVVKPCPCSCIKMCANLHFYAQVWTVACPPFIYSSLDLTSKLRQICNLKNFLGDPPACKPQTRIILLNLPGKLQHQLYDCTKCNLHHLKFLGNGDDPQTLMSASFLNRNDRGRNTLSIDLNLGSCYHQDSTKCPHAT